MKATMTAIAALAITAAALIVRARRRGRPVCPRVSESRLGQVDDAVEKAAVKSRPTVLSAFREKVQA